MKNTLSTLSRRIAAFAIMAAMLTCGLLVSGPTTGASAAVSTTSIGHRDTTTVRGTLNRTYYQGPNVGSNSSSHWLTSGDFLEVAFQGNAFDLYGRLQSNYNTPARVYVDNTLVGTASYYSASTVASSNVLTIDGLADGAHTLRIEPDGWIGHVKLDVRSGDTDQYDNLSRAVERYSALAQNDYTSNSWSQFTPVLNHATLVEQSSTGSSVREGARVQLENAVASLVSIAGLKDLIADFSARQSTSYTPAAWSNFQSAKSTAEQTVANAAATNSDVVTAKNALQQTSAQLIPTNGGAFLPIQNDKFWKDTDGNVIYSQGGGVFKYGDTYYWYGVKYDGALQYVASPTKTYNDKFRAITVYSSRDLVNWKFENEIATTDTKLWVPTTLDAAGDYFSRMKTLDEAAWLGRVGVSYNENTGKYILFAQFKTPYDDASADTSSGVLMLQGDSPAGDFEYANLQPKIDGVGRYGTGDQTVFTDFDGTDYLAFSNRFGRTNGFISKISSTNSLSIEPAAKVWPSNGGREGNAMFRLGNRYYLGASNLHGWDASVTYLVDSANVQSGYSSGYVMPGTEKDYSHVSQSGFFITVQGTQKQTVIYAGDRWAGFAWNGVGFNQWTPVSQSSGGVKFNSMSNWEFNAVTGEWRVGAQNNYILNPDFEADRVPVTTVTGWDNTVGSGSTSTSIASNPTPGASSSQRSLRLGSSQPFSGGVSQENNAPNGVYRLTLKVNTAGGLDYARIVVSSGSDESYTLNLNTATSGWQEKSLGNIALTNDPVSVRLEAASSASGKAISVDSLSLVREGAN